MIRVSSAPVRLVPVQQPRTLARRSRGASVIRAWSLRPASARQSRQSTRDSALRRCAIAKLRTTPVLHLTEPFFF